MINFYLGSIDPLSHYSGIRAKLIAYHKFLGKKSYYKRDWKLVQYLSVPKVFGEEYRQELKSSIDEIYSKIKNDYGEKVIEIIETAPTDLERYFIWAQTDILFISNKRDGLYMSPLEFVVIREAVGKGKKSCVVISEFVGISRLLPGALSFNPYNIREMVENLEKAVSQWVSGEEEDKFHRMLEYVKSRPIDLWAYRFLKDIKFINHKRKLLIGQKGRKLLNNKIARERKKEFISSREFTQSYKNAKSRLILIMLNKVQELLIDTNSDTEYDEEAEEYSDTEISEVTVELINRLSKSPNTKIWIISADEKCQVHQTFAKIENIGLSAEDGYFYRWNSKGGKTAKDWSTLLKDDDCSWIELVRSIMKNFTESTEGSFIEEKDSMIIWNYSKLSPDYGLGQMKELNSLLKEVFRNFDIEINMRKGKLEVKSMIEPKSLIMKIMNRMSVINPIDFVFAFGDEDRYHNILTFLDNKKNFNRFISNNCSTTTCTMRNTQFLQNILMKLIDEN